MEFGADPDLDCDIANHGPKRQKHHRPKCGTKNITKTGAEATLRQEREESYYKPEEYCPLTVAGH